MNKIRDYIEHFSNYGNFVFDHFDSFDGLSFPVFSSGAEVSPLMTNFSMSGFYLTGYNPSRFENETFSDEVLYSFFDGVTFFYRLYGYKQGYGFYNSPIMPSILANVGNYLLLSAPYSSVYGYSLYDGFMHFRPDVEILFSSNDRQEFFKKASEIQCNLGRILTCLIIHSVIEIQSNSFFHCHYEVASDIYFFLYPTCCTLDYSPIVKLLGGTPA